MSVICDSKRIKTFVLRQGRMTCAEKRNLETLSKKWCINFCEKKSEENFNPEKNFEKDFFDTEGFLDFKKIFQNENPVTIEIGFGMGTATWQIAKENPQKNFLGLEVHSPGVGKLLGEIERNNLQNIRIIHHDAIEVLENMICDESVFAFHIFFPDPWPKKKHQKRRFVQRPKTDLLVRKLVTGGKIFFATDWSPYADFALEELSKTPNLKNAFDGFSPPQKWRPKTRFEQKGEQNGRQTKELVFIKSEL